MLNPISRLKAFAIVSTIFSLNLAIVDRLAALSNGFQP